MASPSGDKTLPLSHAACFAGNDQCPRCCLGSRRETGKNGSIGTEVRTRLVHRHQPGVVLNARPSIQKVHCSRATCADEVVLVMLIFQVSLLSVMTVAGPGQILAASAILKLNVPMSPLTLPSIGTILLSRSTFPVNRICCTPLWPTGMA